MPPKSVEDRVLLYSVDGENYSPIPLEPSMSIVTDIVDSGATDYVRDQRLFSLQWTLVFPHKKMSRKKFKKWLMHFPWINRNEAEAYCCLIAVAKGRISYSATYHDIAFIMSFERPGIALFNSFARQLKETEKQS